MWKYIEDRNRDNKFVLNIILVIDKFTVTIIMIIIRITLELKGADVIKSNLQGILRYQETYGKMLQLATNEESVKSNHEILSLETITISD